MVGGDHWQWTPPSVPGSSSRYLHICPPSTHNTISDNYTSPFYEAPAPLDIVLQKIIEPNISASCHRIYICTKYICAFYTFLHCALSILLIIPNYNLHSGHYNTTLQQTLSFLPTLLLSFLYKLQQNEKNSSFQTPRLR